MFVLVRTLLMRPEFDDLLGWVDAQLGEDVAADAGRPRRLRKP
jgi:hypothetical protein